MFSRIVVGTDGSDNAERALKAVADIMAVSPVTNVQVVTAYRPLSPAQLAELADQLPDEFGPTLNPHMAAESRLDAARVVFRQNDEAVDFREVDSDPTDAVLDVAEEIGADLIVVGSRGEGVAKRMLHGSVSTKVVHNAPCSVLVVK